MSAVILEPPKIKSVTISTFSPSTCHEVMGPDDFSTKRTWGLPGNSAVSNLRDNAGAATEAGLMPGLGRSTGVGYGNLLQYSCLENLMG